MARVTPEGISGIVGNMVYYIRNGKQYIKAKPRKRPKKRGKKDEDSLKGIFGTVSTYGSRMVRWIKPHLVLKLNLASYNNARGWMRDLYAENRNAESWELSVKKSGMCQLNAETDLRDFIRFEITVTDSGNGKIAIALPEIKPKQDIKAPLRTMKVNIKLLVVTSPFRNGLQSYNLCKEHCSFIYNNDPVPAQTLELQAKAGTGDIAIVAAALEYEMAQTGDGAINNDNRWLPAALIAMGKLK